MDLIRFEAALPGLANVRPAFFFFFARSIQRPSPSTLPFHGVRRNSSSLLGNPGKLLELHTARLSFMRRHVCS